LYLIIIIIITGFWAPSRIIPNQPKLGGRTILMHVVAPDKEIMDIIKEEGGEIAEICYL